MLNAFQIGLVWTYMYFIVHVLTYTGTHGLNTSSYDFCTGSYQLYFPVLMQCDQNHKK